MDRLPYVQCSMRWKGKKILNYKTFSVFCLFSVFKHGRLQKLNWKVSFSATQLISKKKKTFTFYFLWCFLSLTLKEMQWKKFFYFGSSWSHRLEVVSQLQWFKNRMNLFALMSIYWTIRNKTQKLTSTSC